MKQNARAWLLVLVISSASCSAGAVPVPNPVPGIYGSAAAGGGLFSQNDQVVAVELLDLAAIVGAGGLEFGLYYSSNPGNLIPIFRPDDQDPLSPSSVPQIALIDFTLGYVIDVDGLVAESVFSPSGGNRFLPETQSFAGGVLWSPAAVLRVLAQCGWRGACGSFSGA